MDADGSNIRQLTTGDYQDQRPTFSPDGQYIVFASEMRQPIDDSPSSLWIVPTDGSEDPVVIPMNVNGYRPWFSADGETLYLLTQDTLLGRHQIASVPVGGGEITRFAVDDRGWSHGPFVDPSGDYLLMHSTRDDKYKIINYKIYEIPLVDGEPGEVKLLQPPGFENASVSHATQAKNGVLTFDIAGDH